MNKSINQEVSSSPVVIVVSGVISAIVIMIGVILTFTLKIRPNRRRSSDNQGSDHALDLNQYSPANSNTLSYTHSIHTNLQDEGGGGGNVTGGRRPSGGSIGGINESHGDNYGNQDDINPDLIPINEG